MGRGRARDAVAQFPDQAFDVSRNDGLVLDDQNVSGQFGIDVGLGLRDQPLDIVCVGVKNLGCLGRGESLEGRQQKGLARTGRDPHQAAGCMIVASLDAALVFQLRTGGGPDGVEDMVESHAGSHFGGQLPLAGGQGLQRDTDVVVARRLIAGQGPGVAPDVGQVRRKAGQQAHGSNPRRSRYHLWDSASVPQRIKSATVPPLHSSFGIIRTFRRNPAGGVAFRHSQQLSSGWRPFSQ